jgi:hypothetical protein
MLSLTAFADELEREKVRQRTCVGNFFKCGAAVAEAAMAFLPTTPPTKFPSVGVSFFGKTVGAWNALDFVLGR